jgi:hypothetical protein
MRIEGLHAEAVITSCPGHRVSVLCAPIHTTYGLYYVQLKMRKKIFQRAFDYVLLSELFSLLDRQM